MATTSKKANGILPNLKPKKINGVLPKLKPKTSNGFSALASRANKKTIKKPPDWLSGSMVKGKKYTAWDTYGQGTPDFGKGSGPGEPYHKTTNIVGSSKVTRPRSITKKTTYQPVGDARMDAIQRRLRGL